MVLAPYIAIPKNPDDLASMAIVPASASDDVVALQPNQDLTVDSRSGDEHDEFFDEFSASKRPKAPSKARAKKARKAQIQAQSAAQPSHGSLRPALDILSRIRHDPNLQEEDFIVGYSDRHTDVKELPVTLWKGDVTDEEFIPQHRILYFRRKGDGAKVWDRAERLDVVFGSGKGASAAIAHDGIGQQKPTIEEKNALVDEAGDENFVEEVDP